MDPRIKKLADLLIDYSCDVQPGEKVLIDYEGECSKNLARQLIKNVYAKGGLPYAQIRDAAITREILLECTEEQIKSGMHGGADQIQGRNRPGADEGHAGLYCDPRRK